MSKTLSLTALSAAALIAGWAGVASAQAPGWDGRYDEPPRGPYTRTCREITAFDGRVWARCQTDRGGWEWSSARARDCGGQGLENRDGRLQCADFGGGPRPFPGPGPLPGPGRPPGGGWGAEAVLFKHAGYEGRVYEVRGDMPNLDQIGFNDKTSSIKILRGAWEVCEHIYYGGRCTVIDRDQGVLPRDWNDRISSIRRVR